MLVESWYPWTGRPRVAIRRTLPTGKQRYENAFDIEYWIQREDSQAIDRVGRTRRKSESIPE